MCSTLRRQRTAPTERSGFRALSSGAKSDHSDYLGTFTRQTNSTQSTTATRTYDAFGLLVSSTGTPQGPFGFVGGSGYQEDADSGLKLLGHRYYDASTGRFLTRDPAQDGRNWYSYCGNRATSALDATGHFLTSLDSDPAAVAELVDEGVIGAPRPTPPLPGSGLLKQVFAIAHIVGAALGLVASEPGEDDDDTSIWRRGRDPESPGRLKKKAVEAERAGFPHGVSGTTTTPADPSGWSHAPLSGLESGGFPVVPTPTRTDPGHVTVTMPREIGGDIAGLFNRIFGR